MKYLFLISGLLSYFKTPHKILGLGDAILKTKLTHYTKA